MATDAKLLEKFNKFRSEFKGNNNFKVIDRNVICLKCVSGYYIKFFEEEIGDDVHAYIMCEKCFNVNQVSKDGKAAVL